MLDNITARLGLPLLIAGQAQKEMFHNEALTLIDAALQASVVAMGADTPPETPEPGQCWIIGDTPTGAWSGAAGAIAAWTAGGWRFVPARAGMTVWSIADGAEVRHDGAGWQRLRAETAISDPAGGTVIDAEARAALAALLALFRSVGIVPR